ncbi:hypothetical protein ACQ4PT_049954 [Festuca glaucescens]
MDIDSATGMLMLLTAALAILAPSAWGLDRAEFPPGFLFGAATSAYQIKGAYLEDGKGINNWMSSPTHGVSHLSIVLHSFCSHSSAGDITDGRNGDAADDHYHRYMEDVEIMHDLGVNSYRFSISWARILPRGRLGGVNSAGIAFYDRLIAALLQKGIEPFVTLHHFDQPQELETQYGSWLGAGIREEFDYYADVCFRAFGDRVKFWTTFNEPNVFAKHSYMLGTYPPNHCSAPFGTCNSGNSNREPYVAAHNIIMSHAAAVDNYKRNYQAKQGGSIGIVIEMKFYEPLTNTTEDILAAQRAMSFEIHWIASLLRVTLTLTRGMRWSLLQTAIVGFYDVPEGMEQIIEYVNKRYENTPVYVTENGYSQHSSNGLEDLINDVGRVNYLQGYLSSISSAVRRGANVRGYFVWSLMDNFEWAYGFTVRFGLYHVDFDTQVRTQKMSAKWYQGFLMGSRPVDALQTLRAGS